MSKKGDEISATIEETNKIRKELGLKPLKEKKEKEKEAPRKGSSKAPVDYWEEKEKDDKKKRREKDDHKKRLREESNLERPSSKDIYKSGPKIHDAVEGEPDEAADWVAQHRQKKPRTERDRDRRRKETKHTEADLVGIRIAHDKDRFEEGMDATLVLADTPLLTESGELNIEKGELENVEWKEKTRIARNNDTKNQKAGYDATADEEYTIGAGGLPQRSVLSKYDEKPVEEAGFTFGEEHIIDTEAESKLAALTRQAQEQSLTAIGGVKYQKDYLSVEEVSFQCSKFKGKKGKKKRKQIKDDEEEKPPAPLKMLERPEGCDSDEEDPELYESLRKQRRGAHQRQTQVPVATTKEILNKIKQEEEAESGLDSGHQNMTITGTTQFCKSVETAVEKVESLKSETFQGATLYKAQQQAKRKQMRGVKVSKLDKEKDEDKADVKAAIAEESDEEEAGLAEKPLDMTVSSALEYLRSRDQLCNDQDTCRIKNKEHRPLETSTEDGDIKLEYRDKFGRVQNPKEAFRTISWKFHGKMPGDKNLQRRLQRIEREMVLRTKANKELPTQRALSAIQKTENRPHMMLGAEK